MANYKPHGLVRVGRAIIDDAPLDSVVVLEYDHNLSSLVKSLQKNGVAYTVPTGKKLVILTWSVAHTNTSNVPLLGYATNVNQLDTTLYTVRYAPTNGIHEYSIHIEIPASKSISVDPVGVRTLWTQVIGYEVDA